MDITLASLGIRRLVLLSRSTVDGQPRLGDWQLANVLSRRLPLLYVAPPVVARPLATARARTRPRVDLRDVDGLQTLQTVVPPGSDRRDAAQLGDAALSWQLRRQLGPRAAQDTVLVISDPRRGPLSSVARRLAVYWRRDRFGAHGGTRHVRHLAARDDALLRRCDLVIGISPELVEEAREVGTRATWIPNGVDFAHFAGVELDVDVTGRRPQIGFVGGLSWRVDVELLCELAHRRPDWDVHVHGPGAAELPDIDNLHVHGEVDYRELPRVMAGLDVGVIPYVDNAFNRASFPLKTFEYLAAGVPVVSTDIPALAGYAPYVRCAADVGSFVAAVDAALTPPFTREDARAFAADQTWDRRADAFLATVADTLRQTAASTAGR
ncbi:glycosyltransferase [Egicoccus halophilus]|uniref:Glycosyl transferase n=1 Tax=Egicoccus halophilus TaxID=1670830 RepID=A0A8J3A7E6_9ACTN|nr:glycosyltransferase [Egicoccus halophilus]GGI05488.1 glycosyl transferase [Egicoccus halophilus]